MPPVDSIRRESHAATQDVFQQVLTLHHTDGRADGKGEEGSPRVDAVCRRHRVVRRQGCGHDRVPGVVEESLGREGNAGQ